MPATTSLLIAVTARSEGPFSVIELNALSGRSSCADDTGSVRDILRSETMFSNDKFISFKEN